jgi:hypothetical protein
MTVRGITIIVSAVAAVAVIAAAYLLGTHTSHHGAVASVEDEVGQAVLMRRRPRRVALMESRQGLTAVVPRLRWRG